MRRSLLPLRPVAVYAASIAAGIVLATIASTLHAADHVYVMFAVLLVVLAAIAGGTGPAIAAAFTSVLGDDVVLTGRVAALEQWRDELVFGTIALAVGLLVSAKRRQQLEAERLAGQERALRAERDSILSAISHDVKNPLAVIAGSAQQGLSAAGAGTNVARLFHRIKSAADQSAYLVEMLADIRSLDGSRIELQLRRGDLRHTIDAAVDQMQALCKGHTLRCSIPDDPVIAEYDERRIQRVLQNLIENAIKYSPGGGSIEIGMDASDAEARIAVRDHGIGIPAAACARVFERGYRAETVGRIPGTGLGLFISAEIVKLHGGVISCVAPSGGGTIIELRLPLAVFGRPADPVEQLPGHRARPAAADRAIVHRDDGHGLARGAGEKGFVGAE
jgi:signal transduction histidine kinase